MISFINSSVLAAGTLAIALPIGTLLAVLLTRFAIPGRRIAITCLGVLLFLPLYVQLSAWDAALGKLGWLTLARGTLAAPFLAGMRGAIFVHGIAAIPWVTLIVGIGLLQIDRAQEEAAASLIARPSVVLWRITLPQTLTFIAAAALWTVAATIAEMTVTNIYLINPSEWTLTERFYMSWSLNLSPVARLDVTVGIGALAFLVGLLLWLICRRVRNRSISTLSFAAIHSGPAAYAATAIVWLGVLILLGLPVANLISKAGFLVLHDGTHRVATWSAAKCLSEVAAAPARYAAEIRGTLETAICAACLAVVAAAALAWPARRGGWQAIPATTATILTIVLPGPLIGVGLIALFNHDLAPRIPWEGPSLKSWLLVLYDDTSVAPIMAQAIRALPLTTMLLWHSFATLNADVLAAAALDGFSPARVFWKIALPQRWPAIAAAWIMALAVAAGDLAWCHLVTPPGLDLLSRRIFGLVHSGVEEQVAAISLVLMLFYAGLLGLILWLIRHQQETTQRKREANASTGLQLSRNR